MFIKMHYALFDNRHCGALNTVMILLFTLCTLVEIVGKG